MKAEIAVNIKCPKCDCMLVREEYLCDPNKSRLGCQNPCCYINQEGILFAIPEIELEIKESYYPDSKIG